MIGLYDIDTMIESVIEDIADINDRIEEAVDDRLEELDIDHAVQSKVEEAIGDFDDQILDRVREIVRAKTEEAVQNAKIEEMVQAHIKF